MLIGSLCIVGPPAAKLEMRSRNTYFVQLGISFFIENFADYTQACALPARRITPAPARHQASEEQLSGKRAHPLTSASCTDLAWICQIAPCKSGHGFDSPRLLLCSRPRRSHPPSKFLQSLGTR